VTFVVAPPLPLGPGPLGAAVNNLQHCGPQHAALLSMRPWSLVQCHCVVPVVDQ